MELDERKEKILVAIIQTYLETGEPVGSRTISKYSGLNLSSATIRNEMSDLEDLGYIIQPHTSAGRIPSDKGYRFYVDQVIKEKDHEVSEMQNLVIERVDRVESLLKQMAQILAVNTNYATLVSAPNYHEMKIKFIQLSRVEPKRLLIVVVMEGNILRNSFVTLDDEISDEEILNLNLLLNNSLNGLTMQDINLNVIKGLKEQAGEYRDIVDTVLNDVADAIEAQDDDIQVYTSGTTNIFKYPELSDSQKASDLLNTLEQTDRLQGLFNSNNLPAQQNGSRIQVYIGDENQIQSMKDCSVVTATYDLGEGLRGMIGIVGPKRMDYEKVVGTLQSMMTQLDEALGKNGSGS